MTFITSWQSRLLSGIAITLIAFSCKKENNDAIVLQPDETVGAFFVDSARVEAGSIQVDSNISSDRLVSRHLVGTLNSPAFGEVVAASYSQVKLPFQDFAFPDGATYNRCELYVYANYFYGDDEQPVEVLLYELNEDLFLKSSESYRDYYGFETAQTGTFLNEFSFDPKDDSLVVTLNNSIGTKIFNGTDEQFESQQNFNALLKGISFQPKTGGNGVVGFDNESSFIRIHYNDSLIQDFYFNTDVTSFNTFQADRNGTPLGVLENEKIISADDLNQTMYIQSGSRIDASVDFPTADDLLYNTKRGIYKAEIEVIPDNWEYDIVAQVRTWELLLELPDSTAENNTTFFEDAPNNTRFLYDITAYAQAVAAGEHHFETGRLRIAHISNQLSRIVSGNGVDGFTVTNPGEKIKLRVYFTEF